METPQIAVQCAGQQHHIALDGGSYILRDHDPAVEDVVAAFGGEPTACHRARAKVERFQEDKELFPETVIALLAGGQIAPDVWNLAVHDLEDSRRYINKMTGRGAKDGNWDPCVLADQMTAMIEWLHNDPSDTTREWIAHRVFTPEDAQYWTDLQITPAVASEWVERHPGSNPAAAAVWQAAGWAPGQIEYWLKENLASPGDVSDRQRQEYLFFTMLRFVVFGVGTGLALLVLLMVAAVAGSDTAIKTMTFLTTGLAVCSAWLMAIPALLAIRKYPRLDHRFYLADQDTPTEPETAGVA